MPIYSREGPRPVARAKGDPELPGALEGFQAPLEFQEGKSNHRGSNLGFLVFRQIVENQEKSFAKPHVTN
jgi:hypothetical protein